MPEGVLIGTAALCAAVLAILALSWWTARNGVDESESAQVDTPAETEAEPDADADSETDTDTETDADTEAEPADQTDGDDQAGPDDPAVEVSPCPDGTPNDEIICELVHFVELARGRPFQTFPTVELEANERFDERVLAGFDDDTDDLERAGDLLRALEIIEADADLVELFRASLEVGVLGFYDTDTEELVVRGTELDLYVQSVVVHELVHAHDDQWLDLDRPELDDVDDESDFGFLAIVEGNASRIENDWIESLSGDDRTELRLLENGLLTPEELDVLLALPEFLLQTQISAYTDGLALVELIDQTGGESAVDAAFDDPPRSSEQVLHPEAYLEEAEPVPVPAIEVDGFVLDSGVFGELSIRNWLGRIAGDGWGGDSYVSFVRGDEICTSLAIVADTDGDLGEIESAANDWASGGSDRTTERSVERVTTSAGDTVQVTGCIQG